MDSLRSQRKDRKYQLWLNSHAIKEIYTQDFYLQKLDYIHKNPCQDHWNLCKLPEDYPYSSAKEYIMAIKDLIPLELIYD